MKNTKYISRGTYIDKETGVELPRPDYEKENPKLIKVVSRFLKVHDRAVNCLERKDLAKLSSLKPFLEWETNRLVNKSVGRHAIPLKQKDIAIILNVTERTISSFIQRLIDKKALFRFDSEYYINPSFVGSSRSYDTEIIIKMLEEDPDLESFLDEKVFYKIRSHKRIENMNW